jgi:hypothetical protein
MRFDLSWSPMPGIREAVNRRIAVLAVAAGLTVLALQLLVPPVTGLADNGDYQRVMGYAGFDHSTDSYADRYLSFLRTRYRILPIGWFRGGYLTSETPLALVARFASPALWRGGLFDLRLLAAFHMALCALAIGLLVRACRELSIAAQATAATLLVFFFTDVGYAAPFNSFYSQTASLIFLLLLAAAGAEAVRRGRLDGALLFGYFLCAAAFVSSKPQEAIQGPLLALLGLRLARADWRGAWRTPALWLAVALCGFSVWYGRHTPVSLRAAALYQVVFYEVLPHSPSPAADAAELGLDPDWLKYSGTDAFRPDTPLVDPSFRARFLGSVGYKKIALFYLRHPGRYAERLERASPKFWALRPSYGNLEKSGAHPGRTLTQRFAAWSRLRLALLGPHALTWLALLLAGNAALALATHRRASVRGRLFRETILAAAAMSATAFWVCVLTNAPPDFSRVFYAAEALCDLLLVVDAAWIAQALTSLRRPLAPAPVA